MKKPMKQMLLALVITIVFFSASCSSNSTKEADVSAIKFKDFSGSISKDNIMKDITEFASEDNARITGFDGERKTSEYLKEQFEKMGLMVEEQNFPVNAFKCDFSELKILDGDSRIIKPKALTYSAATPETGITAQVIFAGQGTGDILQNMDLKNKIVLMTRGGEYFRVKTTNAAKGGALAVLFYDSNSEDAVSATLVEPSSIPAASISKNDGEYLKALSEKKTVINFKLNTVISDSKSENIIGTLSAKKVNKDTKTIVIGAHFDGVDTPAANDNASGIATVLETARILSKGKYNCNIKFIAFGAEEVGTIGSYYYVRSLSAEQIKNTIAMINLDMVGVGNQLLIHTENSNTKSIAADIAEAIASKMGYECKRSAQEGSDHMAFEEAGIPVAYFEYGPDNNYHTDRDTIEKIQEDDLFKVCNVVTATSYEIATNPGKYD